MTVEELIEELKKYPSHFGVELYWQNPREGDDRFCDIERVLIDRQKSQKIILIQMDVLPIT